MSAMSETEVPSSEATSSWADTFGVGGATVATGVAEVHPVAVPDGALLVDLRTRGVHRVNSSAAAVFALCDGELTIHDIADELAGLFSVDAADIVDDVTGTVAQYRALGIVVLDTDPPLPVPEPVDADPRHVPAPCSPCQDNIDALGWGPTVALAVGDKVLGVRGHDDATSARLRDRFTDRLVDDPDVPANWSVVLLADGDPPDGPHPRSGLYEGHLFISGDLDHDGVLDLLERRLLQHAPLADGQVRLQASALIGERGAVLVPWQGRHPEPALAAAAERIGGRLLAAPVVVDARSATLLPDGTGDEAVPLVGVVGHGAETARLDESEAAVALVGLVLPTGTTDAGDALQRLVDLVPRLSVVATSPDKQPDVAAALVRAR